MPVFDRRPKSVVLAQKYFVLISQCLTLLFNPCNFLTSPSLRSLYSGKREHPLEQGCKSNGRGVMEGYKRGAVTYPWIQRMVRWWAKRWVFPFPQGYHMRVLNLKEKRRKKYMKLCYHGYFKDRSLKVLIIVFMYQIFFVTPYH